MSRKGGFGTRRVLTAAVIAAGCFTGFAARAQDTRSVESDDETDVIVVTGSLIRGTPEDAALPVEVISEEELMRQGSPSMLELVKALAVSNAVLGDANSFDSRSQGAEGVASVNLRGLGQTRTLVLMNSKRFVRAGTGVPSVDINLIPLAAIGRVEVLKDGAAAVYGSDAVAGVVNFITRSDQEGFIVSGDYKLVDGSDGDYNMSGSYGHQGDWYRVLVAGGFQHRSRLSTLERDWALRPYEENPEGGWTGGGNPGTFLTMAAAPGFVYPNSGLIIDPDCENLGGYAGLDNFCHTQYSPWFSLVDTENRGQAYGEVEVDLPAGMEFEASVLLGKSDLPEVTQSPSFLLSKSPSSTVAGPFSPFVSGFWVPADNPGFIQYAAENPVAPGTVGALFPTLLYRPFLTGGNPRFADGPGNLGASAQTRESESLRVTADLRGSLTENISFNLGFTFHNYDRYIDGFDSFGDRVQLALRGLGGPNCDYLTGTPGVGDCMWLNPFGNAVPVNAATGAENPGSEDFTNSAELARWFFVKSFSDIETRLYVADAVVSGGTGIDLPGGEIQFGIGGQYRKDSYNSFYGPNNNIEVNPCRDTPVNGNLVCDPELGALAFLGTNRNGSYESDVIAGYAELHLPVFDTLDVQLAARYEDYGGETGSTFDPKITARWQAMNWLAFRGSYSTTFRGPPANQLSTNSVTSLQVIGSTFRPVDVFGNPSLKPESANNYSGGLLVNAGGFRGSVDYFRYELDGQIVGEPLSGMVAALFADPANCTDPAYDGLRERFLFSDGGGVPGAGTCALANVARVRTQYVNGAAVTTSGLDINLSYEWQDTMGGDVRLGVTATRVFEYETVDQLVEGIVVQPGFDGVGQLNFQTTAYPLPEWKGQAWLEYEQGMFDGRLTLNYIDSYVDQRSILGTGPFAPQTEIPGAPVLMQGSEIDSNLTLDLTMRAKFPTGTILAFSVLNMTDEDPSFARLDLNYDPFTGNPLGRQFKFGVTQTF